MKIHKPLNISFLYKVFESRKEFYFCGAMLCMFPFQQSNRLFASPELWKFAAKQLGKDAALDIVMPKPNGEVLVSGRCHAGREKVPGRKVQIRLGSIDKTLSVFGDRHWVKKAGMNLAISAPEPFDTMDISYANAFGGKGYAKNPLGKGAVELTDAQGHSCRPLPNVENPRHLIGSPDDSPEPAGFGPLDMTWPQRMARAGTYDRTWLRELFPGLAADTDMRFFNLAPQDQWLNGYFRGDESFAVEGMHPEKDVVVGKLPGFKTRMFLLRLINGEKTFQEVATSLDTVWLFPHVERGIAMYHGAVKIDSDDAEDVLHGLAAYERITDEPRPMEHYRQALDKRLDKKKRSLYDLYDKDLIPQGESSGWADLLQIDSSKRGPLVANMLRRGEREKGKALAKQAQAEADTRKILQASGLDPELIKFPSLAEEQAGNAQEITEFDPEQLAQMMADTRKKAAELQKDALEQVKEKKDTVMAQMKELCAQHGLDLDQMMAKAKEENPTPKRPIQYAAPLLDRLKELKQQLDTQLQEAASLGGPSVQEILTATGASSDDLAAFEQTQKHIQDLNPDDPELVKKLRTVEQATKVAYRKTAQVSFQAPPLTPEQGQELLQTFESLKKSNGSFREVDLAGIDLSGRDLSGLDLSGVYLEGANLSSANLSRANLTQAILARADLTGAKCHQSNLSKANLGKVILQRAEFVQSDLSEVVLSGADMTQTVFKDCRLDKLQLVEKTVLDQTDFSGSSLKKAQFIKTRMLNVCFHKANLFKATFIDCSLETADFSEAQIRSASLIGFKAPGADFSRADCTRTGFLNKSNLSEAQFHKTVLDGANLMGADLTKAVLIEAQLNQANFMNADLRQARLSGAVARKANFTKAALEGAVLPGIDLMYANLRGARLTGADLRESSMYGAEVLRAVFGETRLANANLKMTKIRNWDGETL